MKKFILTLVIAFTMIFTADAQIATENAKLFDNVYAGVEAGVTTPLNFNSMFPVNTVAGIKIGKEITPVFGVEAEGLVGFNDNNFKRWTSTMVKSTNVGINGTVNLNNLFDGYQGTPRVFEIKTNTGLGWMHFWNSGGSNALTAKTAFDVNFNLGKNKAHTISLTPAVFWKLSNGGHIKFDKRGAQLGLMIGYVYHFKTSNGTHHFKTYDVGAMINEIDRLNEELAKKPTEIIKEAVKEVPAEVTTNSEAINVTDTYVFFAFDSDELDARAKTELDKLGQNGIYRVDAYASNEGGAEYNMELSQRRADAVKKYLEERGCKVDAAEGHGIAFGLTTGRVAIVTPFNR